MKSEHTIQHKLDLKEYLMGVVMKFTITSLEILLKMYYLELLVVRVEEVTTIESNTMPCRSKILNRVLYQTLVKTMVDQLELIKFLTMKKQGPI